jgi:hypothetical protein
MFRRFAWLSAVAWFWLSLNVCLRAEEPPVKNAADKPNAKKAPAKKGTEFVRIVRDADGNSLSMDTAIVRYVKKQDGKPVWTVDLIGAVHVGDKEYYEKLNQEFKQYDALLFELVAPEGTKIPKGASTKSNHPVGAMQNGMKDVLELSHQLSEVDYTADNFVHADMSPEEFSKTMEKRGESIWTMMFRMMGAGIAQQTKNKDGNSFDAGLLMALFDKNRALALKRIMAEQLSDMGDAMSGFDGPDGSTIIHERNKKALEVLDREVKAGKKHLGIFYGAGHLEDMEERLVKDFGLEKGDQKWLTAWDLRTKEKPKAEKSKPRVKVTN